MYHSGTRSFASCKRSSARLHVQAYIDFVAAFLDEFADIMGDVISEVTVGMGPAGELRYPAYPEGDGRWRFPGVGQFQCYDKYLMANLWRAANEEGHPEWCVFLVSEVIIAGLLSFLMQNLLHSAARCSTHASHCTARARCPKRHQWVPKYTLGCIDAKGGTAAHRRGDIARCSAATMSDDHSCRGKGGPHDAGDYNKRFWETRFFMDGGRWDSDYGAFFLRWYSGKLIHHADVMLGAVTALVKERCGDMVLAGVEQVHFLFAAWARTPSSIRFAVCDRSLMHVVQSVMPASSSYALCGGMRSLHGSCWLARAPLMTGAQHLMQAQERGAHSTYRFVRRSERVKVGLKLAGVHWCVKSYGHAAELTAGYYNTAHRNGYKAIMKVHCVCWCYGCICVFCKHAA